MKVFGRCKSASDAFWKRYLGIIHSTGVTSSWTNWVQQRLA